jgi:hypothetical protein
VADSAASGTSFIHQEGRERGPALVLALGTTLSPVELDEYQPLFDNAK